MKHPFPVTVLVFAVAGLGRAQEPAATGAPPAPVAAPAPSPSPTPQAPPPTATGPRGPADPAGPRHLRRPRRQRPGLVGLGLQPVGLGDPGRRLLQRQPRRRRGRDPGGGRRASAPATPSGEEAATRTAATAERGFSLREAEITFSGAVDPYFDVWAIFAVGGGEIEVEEGYFQTRKFLPGLQLRAGKFYSGFGYVNKQHPHQWDFVDQNLPYDLLLGGSLNDTGVQLTWLPSLPFYTQLGVEALQGENERFSAQLGDARRAPSSTRRPARGSSPAG